MQLNDVQEAIVKQWREQDTFPARAFVPAEAWPWLCQQCTGITLESAEYERLPRSIKLPFCERADVCFAEDLLALPDVKLVVVDLFPARLPLGRIILVD